MSVVRPKENGVCGIDIGETVESEKFDEEDDAEAGQRSTKKLGDPLRPKEEEVREHERTHTYLFVVGADIVFEGEVKKCHM